MTFTLINRVKARKVLIIQLFFVYPMSVLIHFPQHSNYCLMALANSSAAMVMVTPTKVSVRLSLSRERPISSTFTLQNKKITVGAKPGDQLSGRDAQCCGRQTSYWERGRWLLVHGPSRKTHPSVGVAKTCCVLWALAVLSSLLERNHFCIFSSSWASLHRLFFHQVSQSHQCANIWKV